MNYGKWLIVVNAVLFIGFGLGFIVAPRFFFGFFTGGALTIASSAIDVRATYGGLSLGVGIWFLLCLKENVRLGLLGSVALLTSVVFARTVGLVADGNPTHFMYAFLAAEVAFLIAAIYVLRKTGS